MKKHLLLASLLALSCTVFGQMPPPPAAMPTDNNKTLIDSIIIASGHTEYFFTYCTEKVQKHARENKWTPEKTKEILKSIQFRNYSHTIYNSYAFYPAEQLKQLLEALRVLNNNPRNSMPMIVTNSMMQSNLELFVISVIEGKYMVKQ